MSEAEYGRFIVDVIKTLKKNGYPDKKVALPLEKMYEIAHQKGLNFNKVLSFLDEKEGITHEKTDDRVIFFPKGDHHQQPSAGADAAPDPFAAFAGAGFDPKMFAGMSKLQIMAKMAAVVKNMSPEEQEKLKEMYEKMSTDEKQDILKKAKDMGFL